MKKLFALVIFSLVIGILLPAASAAEAQMKTKTITLYSSMGFVEKQATLNTATGNQEISFFVPRQTDNESLVLLDDGATIKQFKIDNSIERDSVIEKMVAANNGKHVVVLTEFFKIDGTINEIYKKQYVEISEPKLLDSNIQLPARQSMLVPMDSILALTLAEKTSIETEEQSKQSKVTVSENASKTQRTLKALYFVSGANWNPAYQLFWDSETKATLYYYANATNNTEEDWNSVKLQIVSGQPNMKYFPTRYKSYEYARAMAPQATAEDSIGSGATNQFVSSEEQEYHVYGLIEGITIEKNNSSMIPIFTKQVNYEKEYEWRAGDSQVKYNIRIFNNTGEPLAAGFLSAYSNNMYVGGNNINWTAEDDNALVYLAPALDVKAKKTTDTREEKDTSLAGSGTIYYTVKLRLENHKTSTVKLKTWDFIPQDAEQFNSNVAPDSIGENNEQNNDYYYRGNYGDRKVNWTVPLKAGEKKDITFTYRTKYYKRY